MSAGDAVYAYAAGVTLATVILYAYMARGSAREGTARLVLAALLLGAVWPLLGAGVVMGRMIRGPR